VLYAFVYAYALAASFKARRQTGLNRSQLAQSCMTIFRFFTEKIDVYTLISFFYTAAGLCG